MDTLKTDKKSRRKIMFSWGLFLFLGISAIEAASAILVFLKLHHGAPAEEVSKQMGPFIFSASSGLAGFWATIGIWILLSYGAFAYLRSGIPPRDYLRVWMKSLWPVLVVSLVRFALCVTYSPGSQAGVANLERGLVNHLGILGPFQIAAYLFVLYLVGENLNAEQKVSWNRNAGVFAATFALALCLDQFVLFLGQGT